MSAGLKPAPDLRARDQDGLWIRRVTIGCVALSALIAGTVLVEPGITSPRQDIAR